MLAKLWDTSDMSIDAPGIRARNRAALEAEIKEVASRHLARDGAAGLSLRAMAREMKLSSSAIYRYVASRDELLTMLIVDAYDSLADAVEADVASVTGTGPRFRAIAHSMHAWALAHPHEYALLYGSPVPGYHAPAQQTNPPGTRVVHHLMEALSVLATERSRPTPDARAHVAVASVMDEPEFAGVEIPPELVARGLASWNLLLGAISSEVFEQMGPDTVSDPGALFDLTVDLALGLVMGD